MGFEPTRAEPIGLAVQRLNHSATSSCCLLVHQFSFKYQVKGRNSQKGFPTPGVEPGPPGWKPDILAVIPREKACFLPGSERRPSVCYTDVITATPRKLLDISSYLTLTNPAISQQESSPPYRTNIIISILSRDRLLVRTLGCGVLTWVLILSWHWQKKFSTVKQKEFYRPGIEPGTLVWEATMLTIIPPTPSC